MQLLNLSGYSAIRSSLIRSFRGPSTISGRVYFTDICKIHEQLSFITEKVLLSKYLSTKWQFSHSDMPFLITVYIHININIYLTYKCYTFKTQNINCTYYVNQCAAIFTLILQTLSAAEPMELVFVHSWQCFPSDCSGNQASSPTFTDSM